MAAIGPKFISTQHGWCLICTQLYLNLKLKIQRKEKIGSLVVNRRDAQLQLDSNSATRMSLFQFVVFPRFLYITGFLWNYPISSILALIICYHVLQRPCCYSSLSYRILSCGVIWTVPLATCTKMIKNLKWPR